MINKSFMQPESSDAKALVGARQGRPVEGRSESNRPMVTVIGGGIAGLTAAHELTERGFDVQVVESNESHEHHGEVDVGGLARSQYGRIKASISLLHPQLFETTVQTDSALKALAEKLYAMLLYTRSPLVQTEPALGVEFTVGFAPGLPVFDDDAVLIADNAMWLLGRVGNFTRAAIERRLTALASAEAARAYLTAVKILRDYSWAPDARSAFRDWIGTFFTMERGFDWWLTAHADPGTALSVTNGFASEVAGGGDVAADCEVLDKIREQLYAALKLRRRRLLFNLTGQRGKLRQKVADEIDSFQKQRAGLTVVPVKAAADDTGCYITKTDETNLLSKLEADNFEEEVVKRIGAHVTGLGGSAFLPGDPAGEKLILRTLRREILHLEIRGHASGEGELDVNLSVAAARSRKAKELLLYQLHKDNVQKRYIKQLGLYIHETSCGEEEPLDRNDTEEGRKRNRRATLVPVERVVPGEHGFRFFPRHYKNTFSLMQRIPLLDANGKETQFTVLDNLLPTVVQELGMYPQGKPEEKPARSVKLARTLPKSLRDIQDAAASFLRETGATQDDVRKFQLRAFRYLTTGERRRWAEYEELAWSKFIGLEPGDPTIPKGWSYTEPMRVQLEAAAQSLLAYSVTKADTHSYGNFSMQTIVDQLDMDRRVDFILNGPTTDAWLRPWKAWLKAQGVRFFRGSVSGAYAVTSGGLVGEVVPIFKSTPACEVSGDAATLKDLERGFEGAYHDGSNLQNGKSISDFYVLATPLRVLADFFGSEQGGDFPQAKTFHTEVVKDEAFRDMSGIQFYFETSVKWGHAHTYFQQSFWGISTITQTTRWRVRARRSDGFMGVVSIDVSDWRKADRPPANFDKCPVEIASGVHRQIEWGTSPANPPPPQFGEQPLPDYFHLDAGLTQRSYADPTSPVIENKTKYLGNLTGQFLFRPGLKRITGREVKRVEYGVAYKRWVLAGAHMATYTRMMTMEGSLESGMHAVNAILGAYQADTSGRFYNGPKQRPPVAPTTPHNLEDDEVADLRFLKELDDELQAAGLPHILTLLHAESMLLANEQLMGAVRLASAAESTLREIDVKLTDLPKNVDELSKKVVALLEKHIGPFDATGIVGTLPPRITQLRKALEQIRDLILDRKPEEPKPKTS